MPKCRAGADIDAYCSRCGLELAHVIVAMDGLKPARVQCKTCQTIHGFRGQRTPARSSKREGARERLRSPRKVILNEPGLSELFQGRDLSSAKAYQLTSRFAHNDLVRHANFGLGVVVGNPASDKVAVLFPGGLKILAHGRSSPV
jgi:hypothetical protein